MTFLYKFWKKTRVYYTLSISRGGGGPGPRAPPPWIRHCICSACRLADAKSDDFPLLQECVLKTTCIDEDISGLDLIDYLKKAAQQPRTLKNCCVISIRRCISSNVIKKAEHLPLPLILKNEVKLSTIDGYPIEPCNCR